MTPGHPNQIGDVLTGLVHGVYFITSGSMDEPAGMLVSMVSHVSADPPLIMCAIRENRAFRRPLEKCGAFVLHLLPADDRGLVEKLGGPIESRLAELEMTASSRGLPVMTDGLAAIECRVVDHSRPGDHVLYIGRAEKAYRFRDGRPLQMADLGHVYSGLR